MESPKTPKTPSSPQTPPDPVSSSSSSSNTQADPPVPVDPIPTSDVSVKQGPKNAVGEPTPRKKPEKKKGVNPLEEGVDVVDGQVGSYVKFALPRLPPHRKLVNPLSSQPRSERDVKTYYLSSFFVSCTLTHIHKITH